MKILQRLALPSLIAAIVLTFSSTSLKAQTLNSTPSLRYFDAIENLYEGDYRDAERTFRTEARTGIKIGVTGRWIDSIAHHTMWGEVLYHQGRPDLALEQFNIACALFIEHSKWLLKVDFKNYRQGPRPDNNVTRHPTWGKSTRKFLLGKLPSQMLISQGDLYSGNNAARQGGVVQSAQLWKVDAVEIVRTTALAIRRRNQLLGPLAVHDTLSKEITSALSTGAAPPNHWSNAWVDLQLGIAYAGQEKFKLARKHLARAQRLAGKFDHDLTCVAFLELGRLELENGNFEAAQQLLSEASYSAFYYEDLGTLDEAFRLRAVIRQINPQQNIDPALEPAAAWARKERLLHIYSRLSFAMTEEQMNIGNWANAAAALKTGRARMRDAQNGLLGNWSQYLEARLLYQQGQENAPRVLAQAVARQMDLAPRNLQIAITNQRYDQQQLRARSAVDVYQVLLSDPTPADWVVRPLQTLAYMKSPHTGAFERWIDAHFSRKSAGTALEITDLAKRRRYHSQLAHGGKLASLRSTLESPKSALNPRLQTQRSNLLLRYPEYEQLLAADQQAQAEIQATWRPGLGDQELRQLTKVWKDWASNIERREIYLQRLSLERVHTDLQFPPFLSAPALQAKLQPGQAVVVFHDTASGLLGFLVTAKASTYWNCGPMARLAKPLNSFLRELGNYDANHSLKSEQLTSTEWQEAGKKLFSALFDGSSIDPQAITEFVVVPDGLTWYVPFAALPAIIEDRTAPLISIAKVRTVPTMSLAFGQASPIRRVQRSAFTGGEIVPGDEELQAEARQSLKEVLTNPIDVPTPAPVATSLLGAFLDTLVVFNDVEINPNQPLDWSPLPEGRSKRQAGLSEWLKLPQFGPQRIVLPAVHTVAERGGKTSRRKPNSAVPGEELFLASCGLMSTGAQTVLLSRWRVGGQSTLDIIREFIQELPHTSAMDSWQRSVQLAQELPIEPSLELRIKSSKDDPPLTAGHPFFWAGYLLIDLGTPFIDSSSDKGDSLSTDKDESATFKPAEVADQPDENQQPKLPVAKP